MRSGFSSGRPGNAVLLDGSARKSDLALFRRARFSDCLAEKGVGVGDLDFEPVAQNAFRSGLRYDRSLT